MHKKNVVLVSVLGKAQCVSCESVQSHVMCYNVPRALEHNSSGTQFMIWHRFSIDGYTTVIHWWTMPHNDKDLRPIYPGKWVLDL